jgi:hypothetical protein
MARDTTPKVGGDAPVREGVAKFETLATKIDCEAASSARVRSAPSRKPPAAADTLRRAASSILPLDPPRSATCVLASVGPAPASRPHDGTERTPRAAPSEEEARAEAAASREGVRWIAREQTALPTCKALWVALAVNPQGVKPPPPVTVAAARAGRRISAGSGLLEAATPSGVERPRASPPPGRVSPAG